MLIVYKLIKHICVIWKVLQPSIVFLRSMLNNKKQNIFFECYVLKCGLFLIDYNEIFVCLRNTIILINQTNVLL